MYKCADRGPLGLEVADKRLDCKVVILTVFSINPFQHFLLSVLSHACTFVNIFLNYAITGQMHS